MTRNNNHIHVPVALLQEPRLKPSLKAVYLAMFSHNAQWTRKDIEGEPFEISTNYMDLEDMTGLSRCTVLAAMQDLIKLKAIERIREGRKYVYNVYKFECWRDNLTEEAE